MRVVLDVNLLISVRLTSSGEAQAILNLADAKYDLLLSDFILYKIEEVLNYPWLKSAFPHLTQDAIAGQILPFPISSHFEFQSSDREGHRQPPSTCPPPACLARSLEVPSFQTPETPL